MKQILVLTRMQLGSALDFLNFGRKKDRKKNMSAATILFLGAALFAFISGAYGYAMGQAMQQMGEIDVLPGFFMAATCILTLITSIYKAKGILFGFKDYDMLMSLPVKASYIVASRLLQLYIINMVFVVGFMAPCYVVYGMLANPNPIFYVYAFIALIFIPLIPMILASIIGVIIGYISSHFKYSNIVNIVVMLAVLVAYLFTMLNTKSDEQLVQMGTMFRDQMISIYPLARWFFDGVVKYDFIYFALFILTSILAFVGFSVLLGKCFKKLNTVIGAVHSGTKYKMKEMSQSSVLKALYKKEAKRYFTCNIYVFNTGFALVLLLIAAVGIHVAKIEQIEMIVHTPEAATMIRNFLPYGIAFTTWMCAISASSISLEGKNLWILKSAPIKASTVLHSKVLFHISMTVPVAVITTVSLMIKFQSTGFQAVLTLLLTVAYCYFSAVYGLFINLKFPILEWKNETVVVKQSAASMIATMSSLLTVGLPVVFAIVLQQIDFNIISCITLILVVVISLLLQSYLDKNADRIIAKL
ncbi:MAG: hypothetical protein PUC65_08895 [Clostridiales bacterium]|nr:hypothetical protein [Clostridiales bacterium]